MKKIKLIASDLDGCLLDGESKLPESFDEAFRLMRENNIIFAAASGRTVKGARKPFKEYENEMAFISDNGARGYYGGNCFLNRSLDASEFIAAMDEIRRHEELTPVVCGENNEWIETAKRLTPEVLLELRKYFSSWKQGRLEEISEGIIKLAVLYLGDIEKDIYPLLKIYENEKLIVQVTARVWIDIYDKSISKGTGIGAFQQLMGISKEETVVFGDYLNDISMADYAAYSYAPENAHAEVKKRFSGTIKPNTEGGVPEKIIRMIREG